MYLLGGVNINHGKWSYLNDMWYLNPEGNWVQVPPNQDSWWPERYAPSVLVLHALARLLTVFPRVRSAYFGAAVYQGILYIGGGSNSLTMYADLWMYNGDSTWSSVSCLRFSCRSRTLPALDV